MIHGREHPRTSRGAEAGNSRNPKAKSSVLAKAQTGLWCNERSREARTEIAGNHGRIKVHDGLEETLTAVASKFSMFSSALGIFRFSTVNRAPRIPQFHENS